MLSFRRKKRGHSTCGVCLLKDNTAVYDLKFRTEKSIKIKIEVDIDPPMKFDTEQKVVIAPLFIYDTLFCPF